MRQRCHLWGQASFATNVSGLGTGLNEYFFEIYTYYNKPKTYLGGVFFMDKEDKNNHIDKNEEMEDVTKYGEFISSYFAWLTQKDKKKRAKEIDEMTK